MKVNELWESELDLVVVCGVWQGKGISTPQEFGEVRYAKDTDIKQ